MSKILIIEDDRMIAESIQKHLETWGYEAVIAKHFQNILEDVTKAAPDLVLLDITLPSYNGFYWCREIRKLFKMPIIFLSSASDNMNIVMAMDMGGDNFIDDNTLTVNSTRIRKKLKEIGLEDFIKTRKGSGYIIE